MCVPHTKIYYVIRSGGGSAVRSSRKRFNGQQLRLSWITHHYVYMRENVWPIVSGQPQKHRKNYSEIEYFIILFCGWFWFLLFGFPSYLLIPKRADDTGYTIHLFVFTIRYSHGTMFTRVHSQILAVIPAAHTLH